MSVTAGKMIDEVMGELTGWSLDEEQATTLAANLADDGLSFEITAARGVATGVTPGIVEIDAEMFYCDSVSGSTVTVTPWGRGYKNTTPRAHLAGARVVSQPTFPRAKVLDVMNQVQQRIFPLVWAIRQVETTVTTPSFTYALPADGQWVLEAKWQLSGPERYWQTVRRLRVSPGGGTQFGDAGITVDIADAMEPGRPLQIIYAAKPSDMVNETDDFVATTGLNIGLRDVVTTGAVAALATNQELSRLQTSSIEQQNRSQLVAPSAALTSSRFLDQRFQTRLAEERRSLQRLYPPRITREWF